MNNDINGTNNIVEEHPLMTQARELLHRRPSLESAAIFGALFELYKAGIDPTASISRETLTTLALRSMNVALQKSLDGFLAEDRWWEFCEGAADPRTEPSGLEEPLS